MDCDAMLYCSKSTEEASDPHPTKVSDRGERTFVRAQLFGGSDIHNRRL